MDEIIQLEEETHEEFYAFSIYANMVNGRRSVVAAYAHFCELKNKKQNDADLRQWQKWCKVNNWVGRVDEQSKKRTVELDTKFQIDEILDFRKRQLRIGKDLTNISANLISLLQQRLSTLDYADIPVSQIPLYIKAAIQIAEMSQNVHTQVLGLNILANKLKDEATGEFTIVDNNSLLEDNGDNEWLT